MCWSVHCRAMCWTESTLTFQSWAKWAQREQVSGRGPHWEKVDEAGGGWWGLRNHYHWAAPLLGSHEPLIYEWTTLITSLYARRGRGCFKWDYGGLEGGGIFSYGWKEWWDWSVESSVWKVGWSLFKATQTKIKAAIAVTSLEFLKHTWKSSRCCVERASFPPCQINVAPLRGPLVDYLLAGAWMGRPPAPNDHSDVRHWHKMAWKWWPSIKF